MNRSSEERMFVSAHPRHYGRIVPYRGAILVGLFLACVYNGPTDDTPLTMQCPDGLGDTVSVVPRLRIIFSDPLADSSVAVVFSPAVAVRYAASLNPARDTLLVDVMDMLDGNTRYVLRLGGRVASVKGGVLEPADDSVVFFTFPREQEPNDAKDIADTLVSVLFGVLSEGSDIDAFVCTRNDIGALYLQSIDCLDSFFVEDRLSASHETGRHARPSGKHRIADTCFRTIRK